MLNLKLAENRQFNSSLHPIVPGNWELLCQMCSATHGGLCPGEVSVWGGLCPGEVSVRGRSLYGGDLCLGVAFPSTTILPHPAGAKPVTPGLNQSTLPLCQNLPSCSPKEVRPPWVAGQRETALPRRPSQGLSHPAALRAKGQRHLSGMEVGAGGMPGPGSGDTSRRCYRNEGQWAEGTDSGEGDTQS